MPQSEEVAERKLARQKAWATGLVVLCVLVVIGAKSLEGRFAGLSYVAAFVAAQVKSWDARQAARAIELAIGKDLQYILARRNTAFACAVGRVGRKLRPTIPRQEIQ